MDSLLLTPSEVCSELRVSRTWLDRRLASGEIESVKFGNAKSSPVRIKRESLMAFIGETPDRPRRRRSREAAAELDRAAVRFGIEFGEAS